MSDSRKLKPGRVGCRLQKMDGNQQPDVEGRVEDNVINPPRGAVFIQKNNNVGGVRYKRSDAGRPYSDRRLKNPVSKKSEKISFDSQDGVAEEIAALRERK